jgi:hypothetical protein
MKRSVNFPHRFLRTATRKEADQQIAEREAHGEMIGIDSPVYAIPEMRQVTAELPDMMSAIVRTVEPTESMVDLYQQISTWCEREGIRFSYVKELPIMCRYVTINGNPVSRRWKLFVIGFMNESDRQRCQSVFAEVY